MVRKRKPVPLGEPLPQTDEDLDRLAEITPADVEAAKALWREGAPPPFRRLLDAKPDEADA